MLSAAANALVKTFLAPSCAACRTELDQPLASPVCERCWLQVAAVSPPWCSRCGDDLPAWMTGDDICARCQRHLPSFDIARSAGRYEGPLREIVHVFKYNQRRLLAEPLGRMMRFAGADVLHQADAVIPVPLHPLRSLRRGFNQADDLARQLGLPVWRALRRRRHGPPQASLPAANRHGNLHSAFALSYAFAIRERWGRSPLTDRIVVLVDDVMTTGATLDACGLVLKAAGVRSVRALTAARAVAEPRRQPPARPPLSTLPHR
jgi:ComF family protein